MSKRVLSLVLAFAMILGTFSFVAAESLTDIAGHWGEERIQYLYDKGVVSGHGGSGEGTFAPEEKITRAEFATMVNKALGFTEAGEVDFDDVAEDAWYYEQVAIAVEAGFVSGDGDGTFRPADDITRQEAARMISSAYGLEELEEIEEPFVDADQIATWAVGFVNAVKDAGFIVGDPDGSFRPTDDIKRAEAASITYGVVIALEEAAEELEVVEVSAITARSFKVEFNKAVTEADDVEFKVARGTVATNVTVEWDEDNTVAILKASAQLAEGIYTVTVTSDEDELANEEVEITKEVVEEIVYQSEEIIRMSDTKGTLAFKAYNQYGEDVTNTAVGRSLTFTVSTGRQTPEVDFRAGLLTIEHGSVDEFYNQLKDLQSVVVTARNVSTGFVQTETVGVSDKIGVISSIELKGIVNEEGEAVDFIADAARTYYLDYVALDMNGNETDNYRTLTSSPYAGQAILDVRSSNPTVVDVELERHPEDTTKLAIRVVIRDADIQYNTPITFMAVTPFAGQSSNYNTTLVRRSQIDSFTLQTPVETVSENRQVEIPFVAYDEDGEVVTRYAELTDDTRGVQINQPAGATVEFVRQPDGSAKLFGTFTTEGLNYVTATVRGSLSGSFSQISIDVREASGSEMIEPLRHTSAYTNGSVRDEIDVSEFTVSDQYDRDVDLRRDPDMKNFLIGAVSSDSDVIAISGGTSRTVDVNGEDVTMGTIEGGAEFTFTGGSNNGTATIEYFLIKNLGSGSYEAVDVVSAIAHNVPRKDITSVEVTAPDKDVYMLEGSHVYYTSGSPTALGSHSSMRNNVSVVGKTNSGMSVILPSDMISHTTQTDSRFTSGRNVFADGSFNDETTATNIVTVYVSGTEAVYSDSATVTASNVKPLVSSVTAFYNSGVVRDGDMVVENDVITIDQADFNTHFIGKSVYEWETDGSLPANRAALRFRANTQYGQFVLDKLLINKTEGTGLLESDQSTGVLQGVVQPGDQYRLTAIANNGQMKVVNIRITGSSAPANAQGVAVSVIDVVRTADASGLTIAELNTAIGDTTTTVVANLDAYKTAVGEAGAGALNTSAKIKTLVEKVNAVEAVETAETEKTAESVITARELVSKLPDGEEKNTLNTRLDDVKVDFHLAQATYKSYTNDDDEAKGISIILGMDPEKAIGEKLPEGTKISLFNKDGQGLGTAVLKADESITRAEGLQWGLSTTFFYDSSDTPTEVTESWEITTYSALTAGSEIGNISIQFTLNGVNYAKTVSTTAYVAN